MAQKFTNNYFILFFTGLILSTHPSLIRYSCSFLRENTYLFFSLIALSFLAEYAGRTTIYQLYLISLFGALAFLCRLEGFELIIVFFIVLVGFVIVKKIYFKKALIHYMLFVLFFFANMNIVCYLLNLKMIQYEKAKTRISIEKINLQ